MNCCENCIALAQSLILEACLKTRPFRAVKDHRASKLVGSLNEQQGAKSAEHDSPLFLSFFSKEKNSHQAFSGNMFSVCCWWRGSFQTQCHIKRWDFGINSRVNALSHHKLIWFQRWREWRKERQKGSHGVLVWLIVGFGSQCVCGGDDPGQLHFHGQRQMSAVVASAHTAALHHHRLVFQKGSQKPVVEI